MIRRVANGYLLAALADGTGGEHAGGVASARALRTVDGELRAGPVEDPQESLCRADREANHRVHEARLTTAALNDMATTIVAALIGRDRVWVASVGDSRAYFMDEAVIEQITSDHTIGVELVRSGIIADERAVPERVRHCVARLLGVTPQVAVDLSGPFGITEESRLLLCSDGVYNWISEQEIHQKVVRSHAREAVAELLRVVAARDGTDDASVVICERAR